MCVGGGGRNQNVLACVTPATVNLFLKNQNVGEKS